MQPLSRLALALTVVLPAAFASAASVTPPEPKDLTLADVTRLEAAWVKRGIANYAFRLERSCFCAPRLVSLEYRVRDGAGRLVRASDPASAPAFKAYSSIKGLYAAMRKTIQNGGRVAVVMDARRGIPAQVVVDPLPQATDDEMYLTISGFKRL